MSLRNSFIVSFAVVISTLLIGVPMGYFVARVKMPLRTSSFPWASCP